MPDATVFSFAPIRTVGRGIRGPSWWLILLTLLSLSCSRRHAASAPAASQTPGANALNALSSSPPGVPSSSLTASPTKREHRVGIVRVIGAGTRFVLIEAPAADVRQLPDGQLLLCSKTTAADAPATATLRVARERRPPFLVADVVSGEPGVGDATYLAPAAADPARIMPMVLPTSTSGVLPIVLPSATPGKKTP